VLLSWKQVSLMADIAGNTVAAVVAIARAPSYEPATLGPAIRQAVDACGGWDSLVRPGDRVLVKRAGEVIPYIIGPVVDARTGNERPYVPPSTCPACGQPVEHFEGEVAPLLKKEPAGGRKLYQQFVQVLCADEGAKLPEDYSRRSDLWLLQYLSGRFSDVTAYYKGRRLDGARRVIDMTQTGIGLTIDKIRGGVTA
jgi:hypothetical protein